VLTLSGCQFRPDPLSAISYSENQEVVVRVTLRSADAKTIKSRELYFSLKVINCEGQANGYPAQPLIGNQLTPGFDFPIQGDTVDITGRVPARIFAEYSKPCVFLEGGGYFTGTIKSSAIPIARDPRAGPNNSFKPRPLRGSA
jgi:hypothetical protein